MVQRLKLGFTTLRRENDGWAFLCEVWGVIRVERE